MNFVQKEIKIVLNKKQNHSLRIIMFIIDFLKREEFIIKSFIFRPLPADGSKRVFWRVIADNLQDTFIAMENPPVDSFSARENYAYWMIGRHLFNQHIPVPSILYTDLPNGFFLLEDWGDINLQEKALDPLIRLPLYQKVCEILLDMQINGISGFNHHWTCQTENYDSFVMRRYEVNYFKQAFLQGFMGFKKEWPELEIAFQHLIQRASVSVTPFFLHRDFQSRNIMVKNQQIGILDWQGARRGPLGYDLASLLIDPYTRLSLEEQRLLYAYYLKKLQDRLPEAVAILELTYPYLAIQRNLQILGAFAFLSRVKGKTHFTTYMPWAFQSLRNLLHQQKDPEFSDLKRFLDTLNVNEHV